MTMQLLNVTAGNICVLQNMLELYQYELSDIWPQKLDKFGRYGYGLDEYLSGRDQGYLITTEACFAGFAMVSGKSPFGDCNWIEQFFILKSMRRQNLGLALAKHCIDSRSGAWKVGVMTENTNAHIFWRAALAAMVGIDKVTETIIRDGWWQGSVFSFDR